jgi:hypothetical protein
MTTLLAEAGAIRLDRVRPSGAFALAVKTTASQAIRPCCNEQRMAGHLSAAVTKAPFAIEYLGLRPRP